MPHVESVQGLDVPPVTGPGFASVQQIGQYYDLVYLQFSLQPQTFLIPYSAVQSTKRRAGPGDAVLNLLVNKGIIAEHAS